MLAGCNLCFLAILYSPTIHVAAGLLPTKEHIPHDAWQDFFTLHVASVDTSSGGETKTNGLLPIVLDSLAQRLARYIPTSSAYQLGCVASADHITGTAANGVYDVLLPPGDGQCVTPNFQSESLAMVWSGGGGNEDVLNVSSVEDVYETVFARRGPAITPAPGDPSLNFWFISFVNWFHDDTFRTRPNTDGAFTWSDVGGLRLAQVYGHTTEREQALRTFSDGKMKTSTRLEWEFYPPLLVDIQREFPEFSMWTPENGPTSTETATNKTNDDVDLSEYYAIGDPRFNMHPGHIAWSSIALYIHNSACDVLKTGNPSFRDEDLFQRARVILFHIVQKIRLQDFVSDSVSHTRDNLRINYDPPVLREQMATHFPFVGGKKPNFIEFNHVYQAWHALIPDTIQLNDGEAMPLKDLMWRPDLFSVQSMASVAEGFMHTPIGKYGPHNFPHFVRGVTKQAITNARAQRMAGYNEYRRYFGLPPLDRFDQFAVHDPTKLAELYNGNIENVEFLTGVIADSVPALPGNMLGDVQLIVVALLALQDVSSSAVVLNPHLYSREYLMEEGLEFVKSFEFRDLLSNMVGDPSIANDCPMHLPGSCPKRPSSWETPDTSRPRFMNQAHVCSYIGANLNGWFFFENGYGFAFVVVLQLSMAVVSVLYVGSYHAFYRLCSWEGGSPVDSDNIAPVGQSNEEPLPSNDASGPTSIDDSNDRIIHNRSSLAGNQRKTPLLPARLSCLNANFCISLGLCIPMSLVWFRFVSDVRWIQTLFESDYKIIFWTTSLCSVCCLAEVAMRLVGGSKSTSFVLLAIHHIVVFLMAILTCVSADVAVFKLSATLLFGWTWEWTLFLSFLGVRALDAKNVRMMWCERLYNIFVRYILAALAILYFASRLVEIVAVGQIVLCGFQRNVHNDSAVGGAFLTAAALSVVAVGIQLHSGMAIPGVRRRKLHAMNKSEGNTEM